MALKLYGNPMSTCTRKVLATLAEKGVEAEFVTIDFAKAEHKGPEHLKRQPFGQVPVLDDGGFVLYESRAIIRYLDETLKGPALTPPEAQGRARMAQWMSVEQSNFSPVAMKIIYQLFFGPMRGQTPDQAVAEAGKTATGHVLDVLERTLATSSFLVGEQFTLADICYMPYLEYVATTAMADVITSRPAVNAWWERIRHRPSWQKVAGKKA